MGLEQKLRQKTRLVKWDISNDSESDKRRTMGEEAWGGTQKFTREK